VNFYAVYWTHSVQLLRASERRADASKSLLFAYETMECRMLGTEMERGDFDASALPANELLRACTGSCCDGLGKKCGRGFDEGLREVKTRNKSRTDGRPGWML